jgi:AraC family transcriptional regulator, L-rhamnose operon regulatory protein RhaS
VKRYKQFDSLVVDDFEVAEWQHPLHNHNHFEMIFIAGGKGNHHLNKVRTPYTEGDLFLLGPEDEHQFEVKSRSRFIYFKFTKLYITDHSEEPLPSQWNRDVDQLLYHPERKKGNLLRSQADRMLVKKLMEMIVAEYRQGNALNTKIIFQLFSVVILIIKRNGKAYENHSQVREFSGVAEAIMDYLDQHIYEAEKLSLKKVAEHFHYSPNYIGILFKEKIGSSFREYISGYRTKLIEQRLKHSQIQMKQIAAEFGFVDESHLNKFFKKHTGTTPTEYRKTHVSK